MAAGNRSRAGWAYQEKVVRVAQSLSATGFPSGVPAWGSIVLPLLGRRSRARPGKTELKHRRDLAKAPRLPEILSVAQHTKDRQTTRVELSRCRGCCPAYQRPARSELPPSTRASAQPRSRSQQRRDFNRPTGGRNEAGRGRVFLLICGGWLPRLLRLVSGRHRWWADRNLPASYFHVRGMVGTIRGGFMASCRRSGVPSRSANDRGIAGRRDLIRFVLANSSTVDFRPHRTIQINDIT